MLQFPHSITNTQTEELTKQILAFADVLKELPVPSYAASKIFHQQFLKSSLFSARIEGNTLTLIEAQQSDLGHSQNTTKKEINNILHALQRIRNFSKELTADDVLQLHSVIMKDIRADAGKFRNESSAIFDQFGNAVYLTPSPPEMKEMLDVFLTEFNTPKTQPELFSHIANCHYYFEKIHPFIDGNGRLGRVLLQLQLKNTSAFGKYILPIDQYFEEHRSEYYLHLEKNTHNTENFVMFFLKGMHVALQSVFSDLKKATEEQAVRPEKENLLPRRQEILNIIQDHPYISLETLARRFPTVNSHTLAHDVRWLVEKKLVIKHGDTRGVSYSAR